MVLLDNRGRVGQRGLSSAVYTFCGVEYWMQPTVGALRKRKKQSQCTVEAERARREQEKVQKKKARFGESSQARCKLCSLFMLDSTIVALTNFWHLAYPHAPVLPSASISVHIFQHPMCSLCMAIATMAMAVLTLMFSTTWCHLAQFFVQTWVHTC